MTSRTRSRFSLLRTSIAGSVALAIVGCGTVGLAAAGPRPDVRGKAVVATAAPQLVAVGPGRLLHVDVLDGSRVSFYRVTFAPGAAPDCRAPAQARTILHHDSNELDLDLGPGEAACVIADAGTRGGQAEVAWHVRTPSPFEAARPPILEASAR